MAPQAVRQTRARARWRRSPASLKVSRAAWPRRARPPATASTSPIRQAALSSSARIAPDVRLRCRSEASIPPIGESRHCRPEGLVTPNWRLWEVAPARWTQKPQNDLCFRAKPVQSLAKSQREACRQSSLGKDVDEPSSPALRRRDRPSEGKQNYRPGSGSSSLSGRCRRREFCAPKSGPISNLLVNFTDVAQIFRRKYARARGFRLPVNSR